MASHDKNQPKSPKTNAARSGASRRDFVVGTVAAGGGLAVGFDATAQAPKKKVTKAAVPSGAEVNAWVVVKADDTCVIRIARSEMGQGTLTGLAQLVAEELECDWKKVTTEQITPGQNPEDLNLPAPTPRFDATRFTDGRGERDPFLHFI